MPLKPRSDGTPALMRLALSGAPDAPRAVAVSGGAADAAATGWLDALVARIRAQRSILDILSWDRSLDPVPDTPFDRDAPHSTHHVADPTLPPRPHWRLDRWRCRLAAWLARGAPCWPRGGREAPFHKIALSDSATIMHANMMKKSLPQWSQNGTKHFQNPAQMAPQRSQNSAKMGSRRRKRRGDASGRVLAGFGRVLAGDWQGIGRGSAPATPLPKWGQDGQKIEK